MRRLGASHERVYGWLLRLYPAAFRVRYADEMIQLFGDQLRDARAEGAASGTVRTWMRTLGDLAVTAASEHARRDRTVAHSIAESPSPATRVLGLVGILGGAVLLAAFLPSIPWGPDFFNLRLALFNLGAIAIVIGVHRRQAWASRRLSLAAAIPAILANAWHLVMIVRVVAQPGEPGVGDYGPVYFAASVAMWLTDAAFGLVTLRIGVVARWGAFALAAGSVAVTGIDRLGLISGAYGAIFGPLALAGVALNGLGWILLGIDVARRGRAPEPLSKVVPTGR